MNLAWPWVFLLLPLPWLARYWIPPLEHGAALRVPSLAEFPNAPEGLPEATRSGIEWRMAVLIWLLLLCAAARPQWLDDAQTLPVTGRDLMIALDVSASMATPDLRIDGAQRERLQVARALAQDFVARREGDRIGLIVFGSQAYLHTPLTYDLQAVQSALAETGIGLAGQETALGDAIALAAERLREFGDSARVLVLLTDGANTAGALEPSQAIWIAQREGLRIYVVGIGAESLRVVTAEGVREIDPSLDLDERLLRDIAEQTGGAYQRATDAAALADFYRNIDRMEPAGSAAAALHAAKELYPWPLAVAFALSCWLTWRRQRGRVA